MWSHIFVTTALWGRFFLYVGRYWDFSLGSQRESEAELDSNSGLNPLAFCCLLESFSLEEDRACRTEDFENCSSEMEQIWRESGKHLVFTSICHHDMPIILPSSPWVRWMVLRNPVSLVTVITFPHIPFWLLFGGSWGLLHLPHSSVSHSVQDRMWVTGCGVEGEASAGRSDSPRAEPEPVLILLNQWLWDLPCGKCCWAKRSQLFSSGCKK